MRTSLWPDSDAAEVDALLEHDPSEYGVLVATRPDGSLCGYAEIGTRPWAEGCSTTPVGYLEGIWVDPDARRSGVAADLVRAAQSWTRDRGLVEFASDCNIDNAASIAFHTAVGLRERARVVCFSTRLD